MTISRAEQAKLFDAVAEHYDRARPRYPDALIDAVLGPTPEGLEVLDVGCGTGIASRQMADRGATVLGVDLNPGMAAVAERHGIETEVSPFETWDPARRSFDRVTCGQAWHWLDPVVSSKKAAALLRAGGRVCLFWSVGQYPDALAEALQDQYDRVLPPGTPSMVIGYAANRVSDPVADYEPVADALRACESLDEPLTTLFPWTRRLSAEEWVDELHSHSDHAALDAEVRAQLFSGIRQTIDRRGGAFTMSFTTILIAAARR
jgi:SAM-dependent methyltransferase